MVLGIRTALRGFAAAILAALATSAFAETAADVLNPAQLEPAEIRELLEITQARLDALEAAREEALRGGTVLRLGDRMVPVAEDRLAETVDTLAELVDFARANSSTLRAALADRVAQIAREAGAQAAQDMFDPAPGPGADDSLLSLAVAEIAAHAAASLARGDSDVTLAAIRTMLSRQIDAQRVTAQDVASDIAEWQAVYDALDALLGTLSNTPNVSPDNCHADIEAAHDRILARDFDLTIHDNNGTGRYLRGQDGVYCEASGVHFYVDGGDIWERWELHGGQWLLNSHLVIQERDGHDSRGRRIMTGQSRRIGEEQLRTTYTITYLH